MNIRETTLPGIVVLEPKIFQDQRGLFLESYHAARYRDAGFAVTFVQDNLSRSSYGVLRGLHYQLQQPQGKLVSVAAGQVFDVGVDIRKGSPTFGQWFGQILSDQNHWQMFIPAGFAHGFCVLSDTAVFTYKCTDFYAHGDEYNLRWDDPDIGIQWPIESPVLSEKDANACFLRDADAQLPQFEVSHR